MFKSHGEKRINLPNGVSIRKTYQFLIFSKDSDIKSEEGKYPVIVTGFGKYQFGNFTITFRKVSRSKFKSADGNDYFSLSDLRFPLTIRTRFSGDRLIPFGRKTPVKLKKLLIDLKIEKNRRDDLPVITDSSGSILLVPGIRRSNIAPVTEGSKSLLRISVKEK